MKRRIRIFPLLMVALSLHALSLSGCDGQQDARLSYGEDATRNVRVSFIDVGKGDCILIQAGTSSALIDTGYEATADEVVSYLRDSGVEHLDCLVITHYDRDHIGGTQAIGEVFPINTIYLPGYVGGDKNYRTLTKTVKRLGFATQSVTQVESVRLGGATLTILPTSLTYVPNANDGEGNDNDLSLVATLSCKNDSYLLAGDLEKEGIDAFLDGVTGHYDVLKMPHHGSKSGSTDELLESIRPSITVITDGPDDPADKKTLKLLAGVGSKVYRTSTDGTIVISGDGTGNYTVTTNAG